jgi:hypothetical protein
MITLKQHIKPKKMKPVLFILLFAITNIVFAQNMELNNKTFDFWVGQWKAEWKQADGSIGTGTNTITKVLDDAVIEENFEITGGAQAGFKGKSLSVFNPNTRTWHQAWVDNQNSYLNFIGEVDGDRKIFHTIPVEKDGKISTQRMVFYNIQEDSFTWDWEGTKDGGKNWTLLWRIHYTRID